jgi:succinate dehydrogenase/fumarate reductase flavoprotein subunit
VEGLFAAGEVAAGPHGADRIGGCMMTATQVFGARAGRFAALKALKTGTGLTAKKESAGSADALAEADARQILAGVRDIFSLELGVIRSRTGLSRCLEAIKGAEADLAQLKQPSAAIIKQVRLALVAMRLVTAAALNRNQSCGAHYRSDHPPRWQTADPRPP